MLKTTFGFHPPKTNVTIWRYIDFAKLIDLLESESLFFCRADKFDDPYEGLLRLKDYNFYRPMFESQPFIKQYNFISCWHINERQSDAMWKIFLRTNNGIAIKTTVDRFKNAINNTEDDIYISEVRYKDFDETTFEDLRSENRISNNDRDSAVNQFTYKRISFSHEKELRAFFVDMPIPFPNSTIPYRPPLDFKKIKVDLNHLIEEIVIAPFADVWFESLVEKVILRYGRNFRVTKSDLYQVKDH